MNTALRRLVMVRHGETVGQSSIRYYGITDVSLSDVGQAQMARVGSALAGEAFDAVLTSGLQRTVAAAAIIAPGAPARSLPGFNEINFGDWEGLTREEIEARDPARYSEWRAAVGTFVYPNGDSVPAFRRRVAATWTGQLPGLPTRVLVVAHKGVIGTILGSLLRLSPRERSTLPIELASIHVLRADDGHQWVAERVNDVRHLDGFP